MLFSRSQFARGVLNVHSDYVPSDNVRSDQMRRRELIALLGGTVVAWPLGALAQQPALPVIGFLSSASVRGPVPPAFLKGLNEAGYFLDQNVAIETHQADGHYDK